QKAQPGLPVPPRLSVKIGINSPSVLQRVKTHRLRKSISVVYVRPVPSDGRGARDRHERGTECGGRECVGRAGPVSQMGQAQGRALLKRHKGRADDRRNKIIVVNLRGLCTRSREDHWRRWLADGQVVWSWRPYQGVEFANGSNPLIAGDGGK